MNTTLAMLSALVQETRLNIFRLRAGHGGLAARGWIFGPCNLFPVT